MKRTAAAFVLAAGLGGCMSPSSGDKSTGTKTDGMAARADGGAVAQAGGMRAVSDPKRDASVIQASAYGVDGVTRTGRADAGVRQANFGAGGGAGSYEASFGPAQTRLGTALGHGGITPAPPMGPPGAVALVPGAMGMGGPNMGGMYANGRTSVRFVSPEGMRIAFQDASRGFAEAGREAPVRYNFPQGSIYRLRLSGLAKYPGKNYYPTLEVYPPSTKEAMTFLAHTTVPVGFTDEDFDQVKNGNMVVKVIYLPSAQFQDVAAAEEIVSTRLEPGANAVDEAARRGTILAVIRLGNIDLEDPTTPAMDTPPGMGGPRPGPVMAPPAPPAPMGGGMPAPVSAQKGDAPAKGGTVPASLPSISLPPVK
jgi:hypothetical protein